MFLGTNKKNLTIWIAKLPKYLGELILKGNKRGVVGRLKVCRATNSNTADVQIELSHELVSAGIPRIHLIDIKSRNDGMYIVDAPPLIDGDGPINVLGCVNKECIIRPEINEEYLRFKRNKNIADEQNRTTTQVINYFTEIRKGEKYGSLKELELLAKKRKMQLQAKKRERLESDDVFNMIFRAFEQREQWTIKDLADFTGQPMAYIQELIADICVLNKKDHRNAYELKPEYRNLE